MLCFEGFPSSGGGNPITGGGFKDVKNDLISELKLSHNLGGISKLKTEQQKEQEEQERKQYKQFLSQFTMENFLEKVIFSQFGKLRKWSHLNFDAKYSNFGA